MKKLRLQATMPADPRSVDTMVPAHLQSESADRDTRAGFLRADSFEWSNIPDHSLDRDGPRFRPYQRMGAGFSGVSVFEHLKGITVRHPGKLAISDGATRLTYSELLQAVEALSRRIAAAVPPGHAVGILQANSAWHAVAMLACMAAGRPSVPLNLRDPGPRINEIVAAGRLSAIIGAESACHAGLPQDVQWIDVADNDPPADSLTRAAPLSVSVDAPAIVLYTSGSTGHPKGIVNSQRSLLARVQQYVDACHVSAEDVFFPLTGLATIAGCREALAALLTGATLCLVEIEAVGLRAVRSQMHTEGVTITYLVPALLRALMADAPTDAFKSLRVARIGGEKVSWTDVSLLRRAVSKDCLIQVGYSSTETTGSQWFLPPDWPEEGATVPVGWLLPGIAFAIVGEEGTPVQPGESGELVIKSPYVQLGQWENGAVVSEETDPDDPSLRIFATGDLVQMDDTGLLRIIGRKGRQLKINGRRVEPAELERVLRSAPFVADAVAMATAGNELIAFAVPRSSAGAAFSDELRRIVSKTLPPPLRPLRLHAIAEIPRLSGGKADVARLEEIDLSARKKSPAAQAPNPGNELKIHEIVELAWTKILNANVMAESWEQAGGDSLKLLHCVMEIEEALGRELSLEAFTVGMSFEDMVKAVMPAPSDDHSVRADESEPPVLFLFPGSVGYGPSMAAFAASMGKVARTAPVRYPSLQMMLDGQDSLSAMAAAAMEQISKIQPAGHVRLLGHSLGGAVAFEVAARLLEAGRSVKFLGILDTPMMDEPSDHWETLRRTFHRIRTNRISASRMACRALAKITVSMGREASLASMLERWTKGQFNPTSFRIKLELQEVMRARAFFAWLAGPKPSLQIPGTLFRCKREAMPRALGWDSVFANLDVIPIAGGHIDLVIEPHLATNRPLIETAVAQSCWPPESRRSQERSSAHGRARSGSAVKVRQQTSFL
jgi:thioesterase domain-containing protein/acyl-CoA synthetase (AMP-forming)/AMP-acid ligase II/acyl carrier protein